MKRRITVDCTCNKFPDIETPCCDFFKERLNDCHTRLNYLADRNIYGIKLVGLDATDAFRYCPWCGKMLPERKE